MSLKNAGMLRMDDQRARSREVESERDRGVSPRQRRNPLSWRKPAAGLCLDGDGVAPTAVRAARPQGARSAAALPGEDDRAQVTRLIARYQAQGTVEAVSYRRHRFAQRYTRADIELLAAVDEAHDTLSGPATRRILQREYQQYGKPEYERLASISVAHLYNLRRQQRYRERRLTYDKTKPTRVSIGERRRPNPQGRPGYLRVDTVHQGDQPGAKGVYHINAVDEVTQWQIVAATERISEAWLEPVLVALLRQFPF